MMNPRVTIGTCVRNCARTIDQTIESIARQDFPHERMEIIFVDDGSKDNTLKIIQSYVSKIDIKTRIFHNDCKGLGEARNIVVNNANGDYLVWVDGDMILSEDYVRKQVDFMETHPKTGIAKGLYALHVGPNLVSTLEIYSRVAGALKALDTNKSRFLGTGGCIYRLKSIAQVGGFDKNIRGYGEDWDAEHRIKAAGWLLQTTQVQWRDYERLGLSYKELWRRYLRRGYDLYYFCLKNRGIVKFHRMLPPAGFLSGLLDIPIIYKNVGKKRVLLLPFHNMFKATAWCLGFLKAKFQQWKLVIA